MGHPAIDFIGVGRLGFPLACALLGAGFQVFCTNRGRARDLIGLGALVPGAGTPFAVAEAADLVATCLPTASSMDMVVNGPMGLLSAKRVPDLIEMSTLSAPVKQNVRTAFLERRAEVFDAPVSGTPSMVEEKVAMITASGDLARYRIWQPVFKANSPNHAYVGGLGLVRR